MKYVEKTRIASINLLDWMHDYKTTSPNENKSRYEFASNLTVVMYDIYSIIYNSWKNVHSIFSSFQLI